MNGRGAFLKLRYIWSKIYFKLNEIIGGFVDQVLSFFGVTDNCLVISKSTKSSILFVGMETNFRVLKIIHTLDTTKEFRIFLAVHQSVKFSVDNPNIENVFFFRNLQHLKRIVEQSNMDILVAFTSKPAFARIALAHFKGVKVFDPYDCLVVYYGLSPHISWMKREVPEEKDCFALADAVLARNLESKQSMRMYNTPKRKAILFSDYCENKNFNQPTNSALKIGDEISLVYAGGLYGKSARSSSHGIENFDDLVACLLPNKISLHLYPSPASPKSFYYDFVTEASQNPFLKVHTSVSQSQLGKELSTYSFGVLPHFKDPESKILTHKLTFGTSNKFFNFLEAGIPIIVSAEMTYMAWMVKRYNIGIVIQRSDLSNLRSIIESYDYKLLQKNVLRVRESLSINSNKERLTHFFKELLV